MLGNGPDPTLTVNGGNPMGDCGIAGYLHTGQMAAGIWNEPIPSITANEAATLYFTYEAIEAGISWRPPNTNDWVPPAGLDQGVDLGDFLLWLFQQGNIDGFVALQFSEVDAALAQFDSVICGWILTDQTDQDFSTNTVADVGPGNEPDPSDGHCMPLMYATVTGLSQTNTWGGGLYITQAYRNACLQQAFAIITKEAAQAHGFPLEANEADLKALGGQAA
jgi:hypothetical protein